MNLSLTQYLRDSEARFEHILQLVKAIHAKSPLTSVASLGGGNELLAVKDLGIPTVDTYDIDTWFQGKAREHRIGWYSLDLNVCSRLCGEYDLVMMCQVLAHMERNPLSVLREVYDSIMPGGHLLLSTQQLHRLSQRVRMVMGRSLFAPWQNSQSFVWSHMREYSAAEVIAMLGQAGFVVESWHYWSDYPWWC